MNKTIIKLEGYTHADRNEMIWRAKEAIRNGGALILDSRAFSELAFCFNFEVTALNLEKLAVELSKLEILNNESEVSLNDLSNWLKIEKDSDKLIEGTLNLSFLNSNDGEH